MPPNKSNNQTASCRLGIEETVATVVDAATIRCRTPEAAENDEYAEHSTLRLPLEVSTNGGHNYSRSGHLFSYVDFGHVFVSSVTPNAYHDMNKPQ